MPDLNQQAVNARSARARRENLDELHRQLDQFFEPDTGASVIEWSNDFVHLYTVGTEHEKLHIVLYDQEASTPKLGTLTSLEHTNLRPGKEPLDKGGRQVGMPPAQLRRYGSLDEFIEHLGQGVVNQLRHRMR